MISNNSQTKPSILPEFENLEDIDFLAAGKMGEVYKAFDPALKRTVVIKTLAASLAEDKEVVLNFCRAVEDARRIHHENVVQTFSLGQTSDEIPFMVTEFVVGRTLSDIIASNESYLYTKTIDIMIQCCMGLNTARLIGVIHHDVKPENIMVTNKGQVKLLNFGLAKATGRDSSDLGEKKIIGTPDYIAPECAMNESDIDFRSDIYSMGATFYHLLTGNPPYSGETPMKLMMKHVEQPLKSANVVNPGIPQDLCEIIHKMMSKKREERYSTYVELTNTLKTARMTSMSREKILGMSPKPFPEESLPTHDDDNESPKFVIEHKNMPDYSTPYTPTVQKSGGSQFSTIDDLIGEPEDDEVQDDEYSDLREMYGTPKRADKEEKQKSKLDEILSLGSTGEHGQIDQVILQTKIAGENLEALPWWKKSVLIIFVFILLFAFIASMIKAPVQNSSDPDAKISLLSLIFLSISGGAIEPKRLPTKEEIQLKEYETTQSRLIEMEIAMEQFQTQIGYLPATLRALKQEGYLPDEMLYDAWGQHFVYSRLNQMISSKGPDRIDNTTDDPILYLDQRSIVMPSTYSTLKMVVEEHFEGVHRSNK